MSISFPSTEFFTFLQAGLNSDPSCADHLDPSEAYCGFAIDDHLFVLEFDGHECSAVVAGGNEIDLDFVVAGPLAVWREAIEGARARDDSSGLPALVARGDLEVRHADDDGARIARETLPLLQILFEQSRGLDLDLE
jgi:hypothetical protein